MHMNKLSCFPRTVPDHGTTVLYVLAASPVGLLVEFDGYYTRAVLPALRASASQLDEEGIAMLNDARQRILTLTLQADMARRDALDVRELANVPDTNTQAQSWARLVEMRDEFTLLQFARVQAASLAPVPHDAAAGRRRRRACARGDPC